MKDKVFVSAYKEKEMQNPNEIVIYEAVGAGRRIKLVQHKGMQHEDMLYENTEPRYSGSVKGRGLRFDGWISKTNPAIRLSNLLREFRTHNPRARVTILTCNDKPLFHAWAEATAMLVKNAGKMSKVTIGYIDFLGKRYYINSEESATNLRDYGFSYAYGTGEHTKISTLNGDELSFEFGE